MGQKVNPIGMRLQVNRTWDSRWFAESKDYGNLLLEDLKMREFIHKEAKQAGVSRVIIERPHKKCRVVLGRGSHGFPQFGAMNKVVEARQQGGGHQQHDQLAEAETDAGILAQ